MQSCTNPSGFSAPEPVIAVVPVGGGTEARANQRHEPEVEAAAHENENRSEYCQSAASSISGRLLGFTSALRPVVRLEPLRVKNKTDSRIAHARRRQASPQPETSQPRKTKSHNIESSNPSRVSGHCMILRPRVTPGFTSIFKRKYTYSSSDEEDEDSIIYLKDRARSLRAAPSKAKSRKKLAAKTVKITEEMKINQVSSKMNMTARHNTTVCTAQDDPTVLTTRDDPTVLTTRDDPTVLTTRDDPTVLTTRDDPTELTTRDDPIDCMARDDSTPRTAQERPPVRMVQDDLTAQTARDAQISPGDDPTLRDHPTVRNDLTVQDIQAAAGNNIPTSAASAEVYEAKIRSLQQKLKAVQTTKETDFIYYRRNLKMQLLTEIKDVQDQYSEVDTMAAALDREPDAKRVNQSQSSEDDERPGTSASAAVGGSLVDAPIYQPSIEEFQDPIAYYETLYPDLVKHGICKVVPPPGWKPPSEVHSDEIKFDVMNQYISRLFSRWGPAARELSAIKLCLKQQNISFERPPQLNGVEINLPKLYHLVQRHGGLEAVTNKKRWDKVAHDMQIAKSNDFEKKLESIYIEFLLIYDTLTYHERQGIMRIVEVAWNKKYQRLLDRTLIPLHRQKQMLGLEDSLNTSDDEIDDIDTAAALNQVEECVIKGQPMTLSNFKKVASMMYESMIVQGSDDSGPPTLQHIEEQYWHLVTSGTEHTCVHSAEIDTSAEGNGTNEEPYASHPFNPKNIIENKNNLLRYLGKLVGVTVPALMLGMAFTTSCWHQHLVPEVVYQRSGPSRIWYGIPAHQGNNFRKAVQILSPISCQNKLLWLSSNTTMIPPRVLREHNVSLTRVTQEEREIILAVPNAFSCSVCTGYTESESVFFAPPSWLHSMWKVFKEARESCEPMVFSIDHLLYSIGCDQQPIRGILGRAQRLYERMLFDEVTNRQMLQERGLSFVQELLSTRKERDTQWRPRDECSYCKALLFLSKVKGLPTTPPNSVLCLEHTLMILDTEQYKDMDVRQLQVVVHVSVKELHRVHDNMKRHLNIH